MELEYIMLSEVRQAQRDKYLMFSYVEAKKVIKRLERVEEGEKRGETE